MFSVLGDAEFGTGFDANGSSESFELVTEENNGDGSKKQGTDGTSNRLAVDINCRRMAMEHDVLFFGLVGSSSEDEWVPLELCFGMPLFSSELNRKVCQRIVSHKLCSKDR